MKAAGVLVLLCAVVLLVVAVDTFINGFTAVKSAPDVIIGLIEGGFDVGLWYLGWTLLAVGIAAGNPRR